MAERQNSSSQKAITADEYLDHGLVSWLSGDIASAIRFYRRAVRLEPANAMGHYLLGFTLNEAGRETEARREFDLVRRTTDQSPQAQWARRQVERLHRPNALSIEKGA